MIGLIPLPYKVMGVVLLLLSVFAGGFWKGYSIEAEKLAAFEAKVAALGEAAEKEVRRKDAENEQVVKDVSTKWAKELPIAQNAAVDRYRTRYPGGVCPSSGGGAVPQAAGSSESTDGTPGESLASGADFIKACAHDAFQVMQWEEWAIMQRLPVQ